jgi:hypothetical protein
MTSVAGEWMDIVTSHQIVFKTNEPVPIAKIVASLLGAEQLFGDVGARQSLRSTIRASG